MAVVYVPVLVEIAELPKGRGERRFVGVAPVIIHEEDGVGLVVDLELDRPKAFAHGRSALEVPGADPFHVVGRHLDRERSGVAGSQGQRLRVGVPGRIASHPEGDRPAEAGVHGEGERVGQSAHVLDTSGEDGLTAAARYGRQPRSEGDLVVEKERQCGRLVDFLGSSGLLQNGDHLELGRIPRGVEGEGGLDRDRVPDIGQRDALVVDLPGDMVERLGRTVVEVAFGQEESGSDAGQRDRVFQVVGGFDRQLSAVDGVEALDADRGESSRRVPPGSTDGVIPGILLRTRVPSALRQATRAVEDGGRTGAHTVPAPPGRGLRSLERITVDVVVDVQKGVRVIGVHHSQRAPRCRAVGSASPSELIREDDPGHAGESRRRRAERQGGKNKQKLPRGPHREPPCWSVLSAESLRRTGPAGREGLRGPRRPRKLIQM